MATLGPVAVVVLAAIGLVWWDRGAPPGCRPWVRDVDIADLTLDHRGVRVAGTAHYLVRFKQESSENPGETWCLFPLFPPGDTVGREIRVLVRTRREPDPILGFEDLTVEGLVRPPDRLVPESLPDLLAGRGYLFADDFVVINEF